MMIGGGMLGGGGLICPFDASGVCVVVVVVGIVPCGMHSGGGWTSGCGSGVVVVQLLFLLKGDTA